MGQEIESVLYLRGTLLAERQPPTLHMFDFLYGPLYPCERGSIQTLPCPLYD